ncbi:hypothetical protein [Clostridium lundense]|uniref:hypothetical protein n=1 Tax=Clostridium lundense TaxID=319475 RepID=UPI0004861020|nr:hypothetical protein [Clostridium lundense]
MFLIKINEDDELYCDGSIDLGFLGVYQPDMIRVEDDYDPIELKRTAKQQKEDLENLTKKYNLFISNIQKNICKVRNQFLVWIFEDLTNCYFEFWKCDDAEFPSFIIKEKMPSIINEDSIYSKISGENYDAVCNEVFSKPVDSVSGVDIFNKYLPMINVEKLLSTIIPSSIGLNEYGVEFEINSNECNGFLLLATVGNINTEFNLEVWDNRG